MSHISFLIQLQKFNFLYELNIVQAQYITWNQQI